MEVRCELENGKKGILQIIMRHIHRHVIQHPTKTMHREIGELSLCDEQQHIRKNQHK